MGRILGSGGVIMIRVHPFFLISVTIDSRDVPKLKVQTLDSMEALKKVADDYDSILFHKHRVELSYIITFHGSFYFRSSYEKC